MKYRQMASYSAFHCLGGACPDTCCQDWEIELDEDALADYRSAPPGLRERLADSLVPGEDGVPCFRLKEDGRCALLTPEGLCAIQRDWGEEHLCAHCGAYPRFTEEYGCLTESALAVSCPEAARLLMEADKFQLDETDDGQSDPPFDGVDSDLLAGLEATRARALTAVRDRGRPLWLRLAQVLELAGRGQEMVDCGLYCQLTQLEIAPLDAGQPEQAAGALTARLLRALAAPEPLRPSWREGLLRGAQRLEDLGEAGWRRLLEAFEQANPQWERHLETLAAYLLFRHWHKTVNDDLLYGRAALAGACCLGVHALCALAWKGSGALPEPEELAVWTALGREVEHREDTLAYLTELFYDLEQWPLISAFCTQAGH